MALPKGWDSKNGDNSRNKTESNKRNLIMMGGGVAVGIIGAIVIISLLINAQHQAERESTVSKIISGGYDTDLRQKCIEKLKSYGFDTVPEGSINLCVDTAKVFAYNQLNK